MLSAILRLRREAAIAAPLALLAAVTFSSRFVAAQPAQSRQQSLESSFHQTVQPFLQKNCHSSHKPALNPPGLNVDRLEASLEEGQLKTWETIRARLKAGTMPPKGLPQPAQPDRDGVVAWITEGLEYARVRPAPRNGMVRRLTVAQYRNTLKELL